MGLLLSETLEVSESLEHLVLLGFFSNVHSLSTLHL